MDVRSQIATVFHLDKCIGCHTCSVTCKNIWTDRKGTEYMWWANVETKPGTGYPTLWEDQGKYRGGWKKTGDKLRLRQHGKLGTLANMFYNPNLPNMDNYYEPWTYKYEDLFTVKEGEEPPTARPISKITGQPMEIESGPNWDDDLSGSPIYAASDPNLKNLTEKEKEQLQAIERMVYFYLPRTCNHCLNPACVAACPSGSIYKRGEDGIVLVNQEKCRGWRMCISACPYKKTFYNWAAGKAEKCIYCYPRIESGQVPACYHGCPGRIRFLGVLLYDADKIVSAAKTAEVSLVESQRDIILDPADPKVRAKARQNGISEATLDAAVSSPVYTFVKKLQIALPLHPEFRTMPMLFYVPPLLPLIGSDNNGSYSNAAEFFSSLESARLPLRYLANLFTAGNEKLVSDVYKKLIAVRIYRRALQVGDLVPEKAEQALKEAALSKEEAEEIYQLSALAGYKERYVLPPLGREQAIESLEDVLTYTGSTGFGRRQKLERRW